ncbi:MAG: VOC family protein [Clostridia bacterium]|nr:VOC family protein [Clostridia bacterium]
MKFHHISLRVKNFEDSFKFYTELVGLKVNKQFEAGGGNVAYLADAEGDTEVEIIALLEGQTFEGKGMFLCFAANNLEAVHEKAMTLNLNPSNIRQPEPDAKYFYVYDPDGVSVQFREYK